MCSPLGCSLNRQAQVVHLSLVELESFFCLEFPVEKSIIEKLSEKSHFACSSDYSHSIPRNPLPNKTRRLEMSKLLTLFVCLLFCCSLAQFEGMGVGYSSSSSSSSSSASDSLHFAHTTSLPYPVWDPSWGGYSYPYTCFDSFGRWNHFLCGPRPWRRGGWGRGGRGRGGRRGKGKGGKGNGHQHGNGCGV